MTAFLLKHNSLSLSFPLVLLQPLWTLCQQMATTARASNLLQSRLPGWELTRLMLLIAEDVLTYCLVALAEHLIYMIYSVGCATMGLSFFYLPNLLPAHFILCYTKGTPFHWLLFYQECQPTTCKWKWKSAEDPEALTSMYTAPPHLPHMP